MSRLVIARGLIVLVASLNAALSLFVHWQAILLADFGPSVFVMWVLAAGVPLVLAVLAAGRMSRLAAFAYAGWSFFSVFWAFGLYLGLADTHAGSLTTEGTFSRFVIDVAGWGILLSLVGVAVGLAVGALLSPRSTPLDERVANLDQLHAAGQVSNALYPFEFAKLELARTGKRRLFVCGRCGKGISLGWERCGHCKATFDEFPPIDTGQVA
jgi:hypothetical protein